MPSERLVSNDAPRSLRSVLISIGILLCVVAVAKLATSFGRARILDMKDPLFLISFRSVFRCVGLIELSIATCCVFGRNVVVKAALITWLTLSFISYRACLVWIHYQKPCPCLGNLTDTLGISPDSADFALKMCMGYFLLGAGTTFVWFWQRSVTQIPSA